MKKRYRWVVTVLHAVDGTTTQDKFTGAQIATQIFDGEIPRRATIRVYNRRGEVVEVFQCNSLSIHKKRKRIK